MTSPILSYAVGGEAATKRGEDLKAALKKNSKFEPAISVAPLQFDYRFCCEDSQNLRELYGQCDTIDIECKDFTGKEGDDSDFLNSIISGHAWEQILMAKENGLPFVLVVLGDDQSLSDAIRKAVESRHLYGEEKIDRMLQYADMVDDFEAKCIGANIHVWWLKRTPWRRVLQRVDKLFHGGNLLDYIPKPANGERQLASLCILFKGIGKQKGGTMLDYFRLALVPRKPELGLEPADLPGIGPTLAEVIEGGLRA